MQELFISVDIEADGPIPGPFSMVSLGACVVGRQEYEGHGFYRILKPISPDWQPQALAVSGFTREHVEDVGVDPEVVMTAFSDWLDHLTRHGDGTRHSKPVFVAFNATFDWMFVHWYFMRFLGRDPFGISGLDIKAYVMGKRNFPKWSATAKRNLAQSTRILFGGKPHTHNALDDSREQAEMFWRAQRMDADGCIKVASIFD